MPRKTFVQEMVDDVVNDSKLLQRIITSDETQSSQWKLPNEPKPKKHAKFERKFFSLFFRLSWYKFLPQSAAVNKECYLLRGLREEFVENVNMEGQLDKLEIGPW